jgi:acetaldehyde dehydrogenase (acetylating)
MQVNSKKKVKTGIIGTGNIGIDLLIKLNRSEILECGIFAGRNPDSPGIRLAKEMNVPTTFDSIQYIQEHPDCCDIVFDATSAKVHEYNAPILKALGKFTLDLTPAHIGHFCVPVINLEECLNYDNVNLITCGGQATAPIAYAISRIHPDSKYIEIVATIASKSAGMGTRDNIDEFTQTTKEALAYFSGIEKTKAIIVLNPAEPPITMRNTIYALIDNPDMDKITLAVQDMVKRIQKYVPGYKIVVGPVYESGRVTTTIEVVGSGDYLPKYSGNLDIITCAAIEIAEKYAIKKILSEG